MKILIYYTLNNYIQQKIEDNLIKQSKIALFILSFNTFKKSTLIIIKMKPFCARKCIYLFFLNQDQIKYNNNLATATNSFVLHSNTKFQIIHNNLLH